jgi:hypothetical protein
MEKDILIHSLQAERVSNGRSSEEFFAFFKVAQKWIPRTLMAIGI